MQTPLFGRSPKKSNIVFAYILFAITFVAMFFFFNFDLATVIFALILADLVSGIFANTTKSTQDFWRIYKYKNFFVPLHILIYLPLLVLTAPHQYVMGVGILLLLLKVGVFYIHQRNS